MYPSNYLIFNKSIKNILFILFVFNFLISSSNFYIGYDLKQDLKIKNFDSYSINRGIHGLDSFIFGYNSNKFGKNNKLNYCIEFIPKIKDGNGKYRFWNFFIKKEFYLNSSLHCFMKFGVSDVKIHFDPPIINSFDIYLNRQFTYGVGIIIKKTVQLSYVISKLEVDKFSEYFNMLTLSRISLSYLISK